jgi:elongation factor Ts
MSTVTISAADINKLRQQTGAGMLDCRAALQETAGDFEAAIDFLRKKGQKMAAKRSDRDASEGVVIAKTNPDGTFGIIMNLTSETDFVSKNEDFQKLGLDLSDVAISNNCKSLEELKNAPMNGVKVSDILLETVAKIGEKIDITVFNRVDSTSVVAYNHGAYRVGVLIGLNQAQSDILQATGRDLAMQCAAMNPVAISAENVPANVIEREKNIIFETMKADPKMEGKADDMIMKIAEGKLGAFFKENTLLAQAFVKDASKSVADYMKSVQVDLQVTAMERIAIG